MNRAICIHGHFYQPPRENPWLEEVELQDSAYPYHDWNQRITAECYAPNVSSRILGPDRRIIDLVCNYASMSFDFGPTLLSWMQRHEPETYRAVIEADRRGRVRFGGHGPAIAQSYNHMILPLADTRDKRTQVIWGIRDFEHRFGRRPEGLWLAETAVDAETLEIMAEQSIRFTILAPHQAARVRRIGDHRWHKTPNGSVDTRHPYLCRLPSGRTIALFFYAGEIAREVAFGGLLHNGEGFAHRLLGVFTAHPGPQLAHIATDGETYGHHHRHGDMGLAYCLYHLTNNRLAEITVYGEYLDRHPPEHEVNIVENSSWSCIHGIERWRSACGCNSGGRPEWKQEWRAPLRGALDWLRDSVDYVYEEHASPLVSDPWAARDSYIEIVLDRSLDPRDTSMAPLLRPNLDQEQRTQLLRLLEMQRFAMLMYTSCGWFFDEISGIETVQIIAYAARALQLAQQVSGIELEKTFRLLLSRAPSNIPSLGSGEHVYDHFVKPMILDLTRVGAHFAVSSLFEEYGERSRVYAFETRSMRAHKRNSGKNRLTVGIAEISSVITSERRTVSYAAFYFGDFNIAAGVRTFQGEGAFAALAREILKAFERADVTGVIHLIERHFQNGSYTMWHLFKDEQRKVTAQILDSTLGGVETALRQVRDHHYPVIEVMRRMGVPMPRLFWRVAGAIQDIDLLRALESPKPDIQRIRAIAQEARDWGLELDRVRAEYVSGGHANGHMEAVERLCTRADPARFSESVELLERLVAFFEAIAPLDLHLDLWKAQNVYFSLGKRMLPDMQERAGQGDPVGRRWARAFTRLGAYLNVSIA
jgi:alpha-amylase/alpha-mannosidase (GH57 family)